MKKECTMQNCPVIQQTNKVLRSSKDTKRGLQFLRNSLMNCDACKEYEICELRERLNSQVDNVIAEIIEEWGW